MTMVQVEGWNDDRSRAIKDSAQRREAIRGHDATTQVPSIIRYGVTANITAFHAVARGSIPRIGGNIVDIIFCLLSF